VFWVWFQRTGLTITENSGGKRDNYQNRNVNEEINEEMAVKTYHLDWDFGGTVKQVEGAAPQ